MEFPPDLARLQAARRVHDFLSDAGPELLATEAFASDSADARSVVLVGLEKFVFLKLYKLLFRHQAADVREDERVQRCTVRPAAPPGVAEASLDVACRELRRVDQYRAPRDKLVCLMNARGLVEAAGARGENLRPGLAALLAMALPQHFFSNLEFAAAFRHPDRLSPEERQCLADFAAALLALTEAGGEPVFAVIAASARGTRCGEASVTGELPPWLVDAGVTLRFETRSEDDLLIGELGELLGEYQRMAHALHVLAEGGSADESQS